MVTVMDFEEKFKRQKALDNFAYDISGEIIRCGAFIDKEQFRTLKKKMYRAHFEIGFLNVVHIYNYCIYIDGDLFIRIPSRDAERLVVSTAKNCFVPIHYTRPY